MLFEISDKVKDLQERLHAFMDTHVYPNEEEYYRQLNEGDRWQVIPLVEELKEKAKAENLWNLTRFLLPVVFLDNSLNKYRQWHS